MAERKSRAISPEQRRQNQEILERRSQLARRILPLAKDVISEDGYYRDALRDLTPDQRRMFIGIATDYIALERVGRTSREEPYLLEKRGRSAQLIDPALNMYSRRLYALGVTYSGQYLDMLPVLREQISIAMNMDPLFGLNNI